MSKLIRNNKAINEKICEININKDLGIELQHSPSDTLLIIY